MSDVTKSALERAQDLRTQGNHLFRQQTEYQGALAFYTRALDALLGTSADGGDGAVVDVDVDSKEIRDELILNYCNRSACYFVTGQLELARDDAQKAWRDSSQQTSLKAAYRLTKAHIALAEYAPAKELLQFVTQQLATQMTPEENKSFEEMWNQILQLTLPTNSNKEDETSIRFVKRPISIREFNVLEALGYGNFSEIHVVVHKKTNERFALKKIIKKQAADLAKRQHPNVYNEIQMERRVLLERLPPTCSFVVRMFHAFQDYETLYYLMELHDQWSDLWSQLRWKQDTDENSATKMVGCHRSQAKLWLYQMVLALEHLHSHGIVHRDIKAENILLNRRGHVILIDFGTAKDLILTDLNGPEFVGTPDFMSPEAVTGDSDGTLRAPSFMKNDTSKHGKATCNADLWALGALGFILQTGMTPFWTTSPYLAFLRIQRGLLTRPTGIIDDDCWDWVRKLMALEPKKRLGADTYVRRGDVMKERDIGKGYAAIKEHPYVASVHQQYTSSPKFRHQAPIPSLRDLCYRAVAEMAMQDCQDIDLCEAHPPGDGSSHDLMRLSPQDRRAVLHLLDRQQLLRSEPRIWSRFFDSNVQARLTAKIRPDTRDVVGMTQMNDDQGKAPHADSQQFEKPKQMESLEMVQLCSPLLIASSSSSETIDEEEHKARIKLLRKCIARINKVRPKLVIVCASAAVDDQCQKLLARINETIPVVFHANNDDNRPAFCTFWMSGIQGLCVSYKVAMCYDANKNNEPTQIASLAKEQMDWIREQADLCRMSKHPLFCFINGPAHEGFPMLILKKLARGRTLAVFGPGASSKKQTTPPMKLPYKANEKVSPKCLWKKQDPTNMVVDDDNDNNDNDDCSVKSSDSVEDKGDEFSMVMEFTSSMETGLRWIRVDPINADEWSFHMEWVE